MGTEAPAVVVIVVTNDPGPCFEEALAALAVQDYPGLEFLVLDANSDCDPTERVAAMLPGAFVRRLGANRGFGASANEAMEMVQGALYLVLCHDDIAPDPDAIRKMVEEAFRSNAGIVAPKLVAWDDPSRILSVGLELDRAGTIVNRVEALEIDHGQHDAVRDVFVAPGGCTLVRADLFCELGGYDPVITAFGEDMDLSWRAHVLGARVVVAPAARVRHQEGLASGKRAFAGEAVPPYALLRRHELRTVLKAYGPLQEARLAPQLVALSGGEALLAAVRGKRDRLTAISGAWRWNLCHLADLRKERARLSAKRAVPDSEIRRLQVSGSARLAKFARGVMAGDPFGVPGEGPSSDQLALAESPPETKTGRIAGELARSSRASSTQAMAPGRSPHLRSPHLPSPHLPSLPPATRAVRLGFGSLVGLILVIGSRQLIFGHLPLVGQLAPLPGPFSLLSQFGHGFHDGGVGTQAPAPAAFLLLGTAGSVLLGWMALLQRILVLGCLPVGVIGANRLLKAAGSAWARMVAVVFYAAIPLAYNDLAAGRWDALIAYAAAPWFLGRLARATGLEPFSVPQGSSAGARWRSTYLGQSVSLGVLEALAAAFCPPVVVGVLLLGFGVVVGSLLAGGSLRSLRAIQVALGATAASFVLLLPWSLGFFEKGALASSFLGMSPSPSYAPSWGDLLRFQTGPFGATPLVWCLVGTAVFALIVGRRERLGWAIRAWAAALVVLGVTWMGSRGWLGPVAPSEMVLLAFAAAPLALASGLGMAAFENDLRGFSFGWRQAASVLAGLALVAGSLPSLLAATSGRWDLPVQGYGQALSYIEGHQNTPGGSGGSGGSAKASGSAKAGTARVAGALEGGYRVLWVGNPWAIPLGGWQLQPGVAYATSEGGLPNGSYEWPSASPGPASGLGAVLDLVEEGRTADAGHLLAPYAVRYIVLTTGVGPPIPGVQSGDPLPTPAGLLAGLEAQDDLRVLTTVGGTLVLENTVWQPERSEQSPNPGSHLGSGSQKVTEPPLRPVLFGPPGGLQFTGHLRRGLVTVAVPPGGWSVTEANGQVVHPARGSSWESYYNIKSPTLAVLSYSTPLSRVLEIAGELIIWLVALGLLGGVVQRRMAWGGLRRAGKRRKGRLGRHREHSLGRHREHSLGDQPQ